MTILLQVLRDVIRNNILILIKYLRHCKKKSFCEMNYALPSQVGNSTQIYCFDNFFN